MIDWLLRTLFNLLEPVGFLWGVLVVTTAFFLFKRRWRRAIVPGLLAVFMFVVGSTGFSGWLLGGLERQFPARPLAEIPPGDAVVLLGGAAEPSRYDAFGLGLTADGDRLIMALELMRLGKGKTLVIGGAVTELESGERRIEAELMRQWLAAWQLPQAPVVSLGACENTHDEAQKVAKLSRERGWKQVVLVTSAYHLPRAVACFRSEGMAVTGVPCDFKTAVSLEGKPSFTLVPRYQGFVKTSIYVREQIGWLVYRWRGWIKAG